MNQTDSYQHERAMERESIEHFQHPGDAIDSSSEPQSTTDSSPYRDIDGVEAFKQLLLFCMPEINGTHRPMLTCYRRMCITAYLTSPELFIGVSFEELADAIGITRASADNEASLIRALLAQRARGTAPRPKTPVIRRIA